MVDPERFVVEREYSGNWIFYFNNNPIIASPNNPIIGYALARSTRILSECGKQDYPEIQSTTGPGNISASVVAYLLDHQDCLQDQKFSIFSDWNSYAKTIWGLSYRNDERNWRLSNKKKFTSLQKTNEMVGN